MDIGGEVMNDNKQVEVIDEDKDLIISEEVEEKVEDSIVKIENERVLYIEGRKYDLVENYREGFDPERLSDRFNEILYKYDYIVGDWGYDQLRLKGFFENNNRKVPLEVRINSLEDYLYEYCNFGCAYFVLKRTDGKKEKTQNNRNKNRKNKAKGNQNKKQAHINEKKGPIPNKKQLKKEPPKIKNRVETKNESKKMDKQEIPKADGEKNEKRHFTIRQG